MEENKIFEIIRGKCVNDIAARAAARDIMIEIQKEADTISITQIESEDYKAFRRAWCKQRRKRSDG